ncbi:DNA mismatch repair protein [Zea mays]|uniref:DNA mismatch repair protein n=1 Tax=Zea mays TaxID=4577 RepID=A0A1D6J9U5_MAIZE|nr:DNA mismatch repair protein [Zea mays]
MERGMLGLSGGMVEGNRAWEKVRRKKTCRRELVHGCFFSIRELPTYPLEMRLRGKMHAHPGSPYVFGLAEVDHDVEFPDPMPVVAPNNTFSLLCSWNGRRNHMTHISQITLRINICLIYKQGHHAGVNSVKVGSCGESAVGSPLSGLTVHLFKNFYARYIRDLLLNPPSFEVAAAIQVLVQPRSYDFEGPKRTDYGGPSRLYQKLYDIQRRRLILRM